MKQDSKKYFIEPKVSRKRKKYMNKEKIGKKENKQSGGR